MARPLDKLHLLDLVTRSTCRYVSRPHQQLRAMDLDWFRLVPAADRCLECQKHLELLDQAKDQK